MKNKKLIICLLILLIAIVGYGTYSLYTGKIDIKNIIKTGSVNLEVIEDQNQNNFRILPGDTLDKTIKIKNTGNHPLFVRAKVIITVDNDELTNNEITVNVDNTKWTYKEGYYYYNDILESNEISDYLFTKIYIDGVKINNNYLGKNFKIRVLTQGVQSENNGDSAIEAFGWPNE